MSKNNQFGIAIVGLGTVGSGVAEILSEHKKDGQGMFLKSILEREPDKGAAAEWFEKMPNIFYNMFKCSPDTVIKFLSNKSDENNVPCFGILGNLILSFSKLLNQKAIHKPSAQHVLDDDYYKRIEAIQFTMSHDDGNKLDDIDESDIVLLGVSRTSKTPTSIYLANRGYKTINIPLVMDQKIPESLQLETNKICVVGLVADPERLADIRRNRVAIMKDHSLKEYTDLEFIKGEVENSKILFKKNNWPVIDVTRRSVEDTAASILKIIEIKNINILLPSCENMVVLVVLLSTKSISVSYTHLTLPTNREV